MTACAVCTAARGSDEMAVGKDLSETTGVTSKTLKVIWDGLVSEMLLRETGISNKGVLHALL